MSSKKKKNQSVHEAQGENLEYETIAPETLLADVASLGTELHEYNRLPLIDRQRYVELGHLGKGGMGEVKRVFDNILGREVAMKLMRVKHMKRTALMARFIEEAQAIAQL